MTTRRIRTQASFALLLALPLALIMGPAAQAESLSTRIAKVRRQQASKQRFTAARADQTTVAASRLLRGPARSEQVSARASIEWLANISGLTIVVNWDRLAEEGIDADQEVTLLTGGTTVEKSLEIVLSQIAVADPLMWEVTPWYIQIVTKQQALQKPVVVVYTIGDLLMKVPRFEGAPQFDLQSITSGGDAGGGGGGGLFQGEGDEASALPRAERAEQIADVIRDSIESDIWRKNGGIHGNITFWRNSLIVRAPAYVHQQISGHSPVRMARPRDGVGAGFGADQAPKARRLVSAPGGKPAARAPAAAGPGLPFPDPRVSIVSQGSVIDVTGTASRDRRYTTLNTSLTSARIRRIRQIPVSAAAGGR